MRNRLLSRCFVYVCAALAPGITARAQTDPPLTLHQAVELALEKNPERKIAALDVKSAETASRLARTALLPKIAFTEGVTRGDDPVYVFGTLLKQQRFTQADFAPNSLNRPLPANDFTTRFAGNWTAFDSFRTQLLIRQSDLHSKSAVQSASRVDQDTVHRVIASYEATLLAAKHLEVAQHNIETAKALLDSSKSRVEAGTAVDSDELAASTYATERELEMIEAQGSLATAWAELEGAIGAPIPAERRLLQPFEERQFAPSNLEESVTRALTSRPDRKSLRIGEDVERAGVSAAKAGYGPVVTTYGSWEADKQNFAGSGGSSWLAGAELRLDLFPAAKRQEVAAARIALERTQMANASADDQIRLEVTRAWYAHQSASKKLDVAKSSRAQAAETLRILKDRYEAGLTTMSELLRAEDAERESSASYWQAVYGNVLTFADLEYAVGTLSAEEQGDLQ